jgi:hypothetical protein
VTGFRHADGTAIAVARDEVIMNLTLSHCIAASSLRRLLTVRGDLRSEVAFQNDVDALLGRIEEMAVPFRSVAGLIAYSVECLESGTAQTESLPPSLCSQQAALQWVA